MILHCVDCGGPVEEDVVQNATNPETLEINKSLLLCEECDATGYNEELNLDHLGENSNPYVDFDEIEWNDDSEP